jgi:hypothetical protein
MRFVRGGALLRPEQKTRMAAIAERLASLHTHFGQDVLHDEQDWRLVLDEIGLDDLVDLCIGYFCPFSIASERVKDVPPGWPGGCIMTVDNFG